MIQIAWPKKNIPKQGTNDEKKTKIGGNKRTKTVIMLIGMVIYFYPIFGWVRNTKFFMEHSVYSTAIDFDIWRCEAFLYIVAMYKVFEKIPI